MLDRCIYIGRIRFTTKKLGLISPYKITS